MGFGERAAAAAAGPGDIATPVATSGAPIHAPVDENDVGKSGADGGGGVCYERRTDVAGLTDLTKPRDVLGAEV